MKPRLYIHIQRNNYARATPLHQNSTFFDLSWVVSAPTLGLDPRRVLHPMAQLRSPPIPGLKACCIGKQLDPA